MAKIFLKKTGILLLSLFAVATLTFFLMQVIPGDPFTQEDAIPAEILTALKRHYGLDRPLLVQYGSYLKGILTFDLGPSFKYQGRTVIEIIREGFPISLALGMQSLFISIVAGIGLGSLAASFHGRWQDSAVMALTIFCISIPSFIIATFFQYIFSIKLSLLPVARWGTFAQTIMPSLSLAALPTAYIARMTRSNMIEVMQQDYILTAKSKGVTPFQLVRRHLLRNSLIPVVTYMGPLAAAILTGSFAIEKIFGIPGLGQWFVLSIQNRDYTVIMGTTLFYSCLLMIFVFVADLAVFFLDPRIRNREAHA